MAGKAKSVYVTVSDTENKYATVERKMFFDLASARAWSKENVEKYPSPKYSFYIETC